MTREILTPRLVPSLINIWNLFPTALRLVANVGICVSVLIRVIGCAATTRSSRVGLLNIHDQFLLFRGRVLRKCDLLLGDNINLALIDGRFVSLLLLFHLLLLL